MVGREAELQRIARFLTAGKHGHAVCLISGDPGIGKSSLLDAARAGALRRGFAVLSAAPDESEIDLPFAGLEDLVASAPVDLSAGLPSFLRAVRALAERSPVLIAVDDLHWLDNSSWRALRFALRRLDGTRVAVAAALRSDESERARAVVRSAGRASVERFRLAPLPDDAIEELLRSRNLLPASRTARRRLLETAGGNPYFALELAIGLRDGERALPPALSSALRAQLAGAPPLVVRAVVVAALERRADRALLTGLLGRGGTAAVDGALARGLLRDDDARGMRPAHPLLGAAAIELTQPAVLRRLHRRLAGEVPDPVARAFHLARASVAADPDAAAAIEAAARDAQRRGAPSEAAQLYAHAARLTPAGSSGDRHRRLLAAAELRAAAGETGEAIEALEQLADSLEHGPLRAAVLGRLGALRYRVDRMDVAIDTFRAALEDADDDPGTRVDLLRRLSLATMMSGDLAAAAALAADASGIAAGAALAETRAFESMVHAVMGRAGAAKRAAAVRPASTTTLDVPAELRTTTIRALASNILHGSERGAIEFGELCRRAERDGELASLPYLLANLCEAQIASGAWDEADAVAARATPLLEDEPDALGSFLLAALARLAACRGRLADAGRLGNRGLELALRGGIVPAIHYNAAALAFLELTRGDYRAVAARLRELVAGMAAVGLGEPQFARFVPDQIEALIRLGELDSARATLAWWEERARILERPFGLATAARCRALLRAADGDAGAEDALAAAAEHHTDLREPFERARTDLVAAEIHRRARRRGRASEAAAAASETFETLGAPVWAEKVDDERARLGTRRHRGETRLTETEERIASLVAAGRTNREIASAIFVANSTVEAALWRIYRKLDLRSRTELTRWHLAARDAPPRPAGRGGANRPG